MRLKNTSKKTNYTVTKRFYMYGVHNDIVAIEN